MATVNFKGNPIKISGNLPAVGEMAPEFVLTKTDLSDLRLSDLRGKKLILNIFPSIDTGVCATSVRKFNQEVNGRENTLCLCISADLPFAHSRFCGAEGLQNVVSLSEMHKKSFGEVYGVRLEEGPLAGLLARAVLVVNPEGRVVHQELVPEITQEPDYQAALAAL